MKLWNLTFPNPVGVAAGFDKGAEAVTGLASIGFGFIEANSSWLWVMFWAAYRVWKNEVCKSKISVLGLKSITIIDLNLVPFAIPLQLKTGPVERRSLGVLVGEVVSDLCTTAPRLLLKRTASETRDSPIYYEQRRSLCQVRTKYKCKSVIIIYPGPTSTQPD